MNTDENSILPESQPEAVPEGQEAQPSELVGLLSMRQLCRELRLPYKWVRKLVRAGQLPLVKAGVKYLFDPIVVARKVRGMAGSDNQFGVSPEQCEYWKKRAEEKVGAPSKETLLQEKLVGKLLGNARKKSDKQKRERGDYS
jgi:hypothetical protein